VGEKTFIDRLRRHPLARAIRSDKLCLAALITTLSHYIKDEALQEIPVWQMIATPAEQLQERAEVWVKQLGQGEVLQGRSTVGGGSLPEETLPTWLLALTIRHPNAFVSRLRLADPPVIARVEDDRVLLDPRTVLQWQEKSLLKVLKGML
jgi:L-seryl-tRNA(Ser) seleniumtransferase